MEAISIRPHAPASGADERRLRHAAVELEAAFLASMLKHAGFGESRETFGGGAGENAFSGMLAGEQARLLAERGGIGLAESLVEALARSGGETQ